MTQAFIDSRIPTVGRRRTIKKRQDKVPGSWHRWEPRTGLLCFGMQSSHRPDECQHVLTSQLFQKRCPDCVRRAFAFLVHLSALAHVNVELTFSNRCKEIALHP